LTNSEVTPQAVWDGSKTQSANHDPLGSVFYSNYKANIIADCLENQFRAHDLFDCDHTRHVEAKIEALLATVGEDIPANFRPCDVSKQVKSLKLVKVCSFDGIIN
jgi:hypothetical protein